MIISYINLLNPILDNLCVAEDELCPRNRARFLNTLYHRFVYKILIKLVLNLVLAVQVILLPVALLILLCTFRYFTVTMLQVQSTCFMNNYHGTVTITMVQVKS